MTQHWILQANAGLLFRKARLLHFRTQTQAISASFRREFDVQPDILILHLGVCFGGVIVKGTRDDGDLAALLEDCLLTGGCDKGDGLRAGSLAVVCIGDGLGKAVNPSRTVQLRDEFPRALNVLR